MRADNNPLYTKKFVMLWHLDLRVLKALVLTHLRQDFVENIDSFCLHFAMFVMISSIVSGDLQTSVL